jgi:hypothetical protein
MRPSSERLRPVEARYDWVAKGNCVSVRTGGEQSEAKDQPQTKVNSIRPVNGTSQQHKHICGEPGVCGEVGDASLPLSSENPRQSGTEERSWVVGVRMVRRPHGRSHESCALEGRSDSSQSPHSSCEAGNAVEQRRVGR